MAIDYEAIYKQAEENRSWFSLMSYPRLLFYWQIKHPGDVKAIATVASHRLGKHTWCGEKCANIGAFIAKWELGQKKLVEEKG